MVHGLTKDSPVSVRASGMPCAPGMFTSEQEVGWKKIVEAVHAKEGLFFAQLWHQGRNTHSIASGQQPISSSAIAMNGATHWNTLPSLSYEVPKAMTKEEIEETKEEFAAAAIRARAAGFDGVEFHGGNGYLFDQFLHDNSTSRAVSPRSIVPLKTLVNIREDDYGGSIENRCRFLLETVDKVAAVIGSGRLAVRLTPFGLFNDARGTQRVEQWTYLCGELSKRKLAYVYVDHLLIVTRLRDAQAYD